MYIIFEFTISCDQEEDFFDMPVLTVIFRLCLERLVKKKKTKVTAKVPKNCGVLATQNAQARSKRVTWVEKTKRLHEAGALISENELPGTQARAMSEDFKEYIGDAKFFFAF